MVPQATRQLGIPDSPFLTLEEGARHCRFDTCLHPVVAFRQWLRRQGVPVVRRGRVLLIDRRVLDAVLTDASRGGR
jgi:hypothetical protein